MTPDDSDPVYTLELLAGDADPIVEVLSAPSDEDAIELSRLRLLLGREVSVVRLWADTRLVVTFRRDSPRRSYKVVQ